MVLTVQLKINISFLTEMFLVHDNLNNPKFNQLFGNYDKKEKFTKMKNKSSLKNLNPFSTNVPLLYFLKTSENL